MDTCGLYHENIMKLIPRIADSEKRAFMEAALAGFKAVFEAGSQQPAQPQTQNRPNLEPRMQIAQADNTRVNQYQQQRKPQPVSQKPVNTQTKHQGQRLHSQEVHYSPHRDLFPHKGSINPILPNNEVSKMPTVEQTKEKACEMKEKERRDINIKFANNPMMLKQEIAKLNQKYAKMGCPVDFSNVQAQQSSSSAAYASSSTAQHSSSSALPSASSSVSPISSSSSQSASSNMPSASSSAQSSSSKNKNEGRTCRVGNGVYAVSADNKTIKTLNGAVITSEVKKQCGVNQK